MSISNVELGTIFDSLSFINKLFFLYFCGVSVYTLYLTLYVLFRLHSLRKQPQNENASPAQFSLGILNRRLANLRQLHLFTLYLFGFCILVSVPSAFVSLELSNTWPIRTYILNLRFLFSFDTAIFLGFLLLHSIQWIVSARVNSAVGQHGSLSG